MIGKKCLFNITDVVLYARDSNWKSSRISCLVVCRDRTNILTKA